MGRANTENISCHFRFLHCLYSFLHPLLCLSSSPVSRNLRFISLLHSPLHSWAAHCSLQAFLLLPSLFPRSRKPVGIAQSFRADRLTQALYAPAIIRGSVGKGECFFTEMNGSVYSARLHVGLQGVLK